MTIFQLFFFFFRISAVTFGGGIVILGMVKLGIADRKDISDTEFSDMLSLAASVPGPLAVSISWLLGRYYRGLKGSVAAVAGAVLPPFLIILILSPIILKYSGTTEVQGFFKGVLAGTGAIITMVVFDNVRSTLSCEWWNIVPFVIVIALIGVFGINPPAFYACGIFSTADKGKACITMKVLLELAFSFAQIAVGAFGGGLSTLPLIEYQLVKATGWLTSSQFGQVLALSQVTPGPIAINAATFVGFQQAGIPGSIVSTLSIVIVPVLILCAVSCVLKKLEAEKSRKFKDMLRPIVAGLLTLSLVSPLTVTVKNGVMTMAMLVIGILLMRTCKFFKNYPPLLLVIYGIIGAVIFS